jgi:hypothetical protein
MASNGMRPGQHGRSVLRPAKDFRDFLVMHSHSD